MLLKLKHATSLKQGIRLSYFMCKLTDYGPQIDYKVLMIYQVR